MRRTTLIVGMLAALAAGSGPAVAGTVVCSRSHELADALHQTFGELPVSSGLQPNGELLQIFASPQTGSWTAVTTSPQGVSCVLVTGQRWIDPRQGAVGAQVALPRG